ncbi:MAG: hypothetical protein C4322_10520 [Mastigocladus sp. ERB_26_1]
MLILVNNMVGSQKFLSCVVSGNLYIQPESKTGKYHSLIAEKILPLQHKHGNSYSNHLKYIVI